MPTDLHNDPMYIGPQAWANLQQQYTQNQLSQATTRRWDTNTGQYNIFWNPNTNINNIPREVQNNMQPSSSTINPALGTDRLAGGGNTGQYSQDQIMGMFGSGESSAFNAMNALQQRRESMLAEQQGMYSQMYEDANARLNAAIGRDVYQEYQAELQRQGYDQKLGLLNEYNAQLRDLTLDYQMGRQNIRRESRLESMTKGRQALIYEQYANEATLINNNIAGVQGQLDRIEKNTDKFFDFYSQQRQDEISNYTNLRDLANQNIISLSKEERDNIDNRISIIQSELERNDAERDSKRELLRAAYEKGVDPSKLGVSLTDDFDTMMSKLGSAVAAQYQKELEMSNSRSSSSSSGATSYPTNAKSPLQKLAYDTAENIVGLEGSGFSGEDWNTQVNNFIARAGEMGLSLSWQQASDTLAQGMTQYKGANNMAQLNTSNPASDTNQGGGNTPPVGGAEGAGIKAREIIQGLQNRYVTMKTAKTLAQIELDVMRYGNVSVAVAKKIAKDIFNSNWFNKFKKGLNGQ